MKTYIITRELSGVACRVEVTIPGSEPSIYPLRHLIWHSPTGFECGDSGYGPADLALSILADHFGFEEKQAEVRDVLLGKRSTNYLARVAAGLHQDFKFAFIGRIKLDLLESRRLEDFLISEWLIKTLTLDYMRENPVISHSGPVSA